MDKTDLYIRMVDHPLIQGLRGPQKWEEGDFYTDEVLKNHPDRVGVHADGTDEPYEMYKPIWLPRPDQWIDMLPEGALEMDVFRTDLGEWQIQGTDYYSTGYHKSFEQVLAVFTMHEIHGFEWTGEGWEK